jgi:hypothetical protein
MDRSGATDSGFQFAVMRRGEETFREGRSRWRLVGSEYPVQLNGQVTHIDFVYEQGDTPVTTVLVAKCKRVDRRERGGRS